MAFAFTCYGNDETIASTSIYATGINMSYTVPYGETLDLAGFPDSVRFTANPSEGCSFTRWVYRLGSTTGTVQYSTDNPFTYSGNEDIYIRAEGISDVSESTWNISSDSIGTLSYDTYTSVYLDEYTLYRFSVSFAKSGNVTFSTKGLVDTYGFLSTSPNWDSYNGVPTQFLASNDDSNGSDFSISYNVTAGTPYYVWVRSYNGTDTGNTELVITAPQSSSVEWNIDETFSYYNASDKYKPSGSTTIKKNTVIKIKCNFLNSCTVGFTGYVLNSDIICYLSTSPTWNHEKGEPENYLISSTKNSYDLTDASLYYNVKTGVDYYFWVRLSSTSTTSIYQMSFYITPSAAVGPSNWNWQVSNGTATSSETNAAYNAVVNKTAVKNFSHLVWNDLVDKVKEVIESKSLAWDITYASYANTRMVTAPYELTATKFNSLRNNIEIVANKVGIAKISDTDIPHPVYSYNSDYPVKGSYFIVLANYLNSVIDSL